MPKLLSDDEVFGAPATGGLLSDEDVFGVVEPPKTKGRTWAEAAADTGVQLAEGVNTIAGAVPDLIAPQSGVSRFFRDNADYWRDKQSDALKSRIAAADAAIARAGEDGVVSQAGEAASQYVRDPGLAARFVVTNLPSMIPGIGAAKAAQVAALARGTGATRAASAATVAAGGVNAILNAGGARGDAFEDIKQTLEAQGMSSTEAEERALSASVLPAAVGGVAGFVSGKTGLEHSLFGAAAGKSAAKSAAAATASELAGEQLEEVVPKLATNYQAGQYDGRPLGKDVGRTIVETAIGSGPGSVVAGGAAYRQAGQPAAKTPTAPDVAEMSPPVPEAAPAVLDSAPSVSPPVQSIASPPDPLARLAELELEAERRALTPDELTEAQALITQLQGDDDGSVAAGTHAEVVAPGDETGSGVVPGGIHPAAAARDGAAGGDSGAATVDEAGARPPEVAAPAGMGSGVDAAQSAQMAEEAQEADAAQAGAEQVAAPQGAVTLPPLQTPSQPTTTGILQQTPATLPMPKLPPEHAARVAEIDSRLAGIAADHPNRTPAVQASLEREAGRLEAEKGEITQQAQLAQQPQAKAPRGNQAPIMKRDDLVGAIMRVTGGRGVAASMAQTVTGDTANRVSKLRGLFTAQGVQDLDDTAMLLREEEGYDVRDGEHLAELLREAAAGNVAVSMERAERDADEHAARQHRDAIRELARELGVKTVARRFDDIERDVIAAEQKANADEADQERLAIQAEAEASEFSEDTINELLRMAAADNDGRYINDQWITDEQILEAVESIGESEEESAAPHVIATAGREAPGNRSERGGKARHGQGGNGRGRDKAVRQGDKQSRQGDGSAELTLTGQTNEEAAADFAKQQQGEPELTKDQIDREASGFSLQQESQASPKQAPTGGQGGLFTADGRASVEAAGNDQAIGYNAEQRTKRDDYTRDLFGHELPGTALPDRGVEQPPAAQNRDMVAASLVPGARFATVAEPRQTGEIRSAFERVESAPQAAHVFAGLRKSPQERFAVLVLDKANRPIAALRLFAGATTQTGVFPEVVTKAVYETPGAASVWYAHNHPSGNPEPSEADERITAMLSSAFGDGTGVSVAGHVIIAGGQACELDASGHAIGSAFAIPPGVRRYEIPVTERIFKKVGSLGNAVTSPEVAGREIPRVANGGSGVVFADARSRPVAFLPMNANAMLKLRDGAENSGARQLFGAAGRSNGVAAFVHFADDVPAQLAQRAAYNIYSALDWRGIRVLDALYRGADGALQSMSEIGTLSGNARGQFESRQSSADQFVVAPDGSVDFGEITEAQAKTMRRQAGKIRLEKGDGSYGLQHIEERHGAQIRALGFDSIEAFVADAVGHIESIWQPKRTSQLVMIQAADKGRAVFVELKPSADGDFYTINTAFPIGKFYAQNKGWILLWGGASVPTEASGANPLAEPSPNAGATATMTPGQSSSSSISSDDGLNKAGNESIAAAINRPSGGFEKVRYDMVAGTTEVFRRQFKGAAALDIRVVNSREEIPLHHRPSPYAEGVYHDRDGVIYLIAKNLPTKLRTWQVLMHETVGHYGLANLMGKKFAGLWQTVLAQANASHDLERHPAPGDADYATVDAVRLLYPEADDNEIAQEVLARMAETMNPPSWARAALAKVRQWLKSVAEALGVTWEPSMKDARDMVVMAAEHLRMGRNLDSAHSSEGLAFTSRRQDGNINGMADENSVASKQAPTSAGDDSRGAQVSLFHGSAERVHEIKNRGAYGGLFASFSKDSALSHGDILHRIDLAESSIMRQSEMEEVTDEQLLDAAHWVSPEDIDRLRELVVDDVAAKDGDAEIMHVDDAAEASIEAQRLRGVIAKSLGYKAVEMNDEHGTSYLILPGAIISNEQSAPAGSGAMESRAIPAAGGQAVGNWWQAAKAKAQELASPEILDTLIYNFQDKMIDLKRLRDRIKALQGTITDLNDAYLGEELYHGRVAKRTEEFLADELKPLLADLRASGIGIAEFESFLHARHAPEANAELAKRNPNLKEIEDGRQKAAAQVKALATQLQSAQAAGKATRAIEQAMNTARGELAKWNGAQAFQGTEEERLSLSGMSDAEAAAVMANIPAAKRAHFDAQAARVDAINGKTLKLLEQYGLMDKASLDAWRTAYQHYVPLHRDEAHPDSGHHPVGQGFSVKGDSAKRRTGSNEKVTHILGHIAMQREAAITRGEKNNVTKKLYLMAAQNPDKDFWLVDKPPTIKTVDKSTGFVRSSLDPLYKNKPNVVMLRIAGKDVAVVFNEHNKEAVRLAASLKNLDASDFHAALGLAAKGTRWFASINTQYNPIFGLINLARDAQSGILNLGTTAIADRKAEVTRGILPALRAVYGVERGGKPLFGAYKPDPAWAKLWEEFQEVGGQTGYRDLYANAEDRTDALLKELKSLDRGQVGKAMHAVADLLSDYNTAMENAVRLSAYKAALDKGISKERAASIAKNLTVNFNRKGAQAREIGALYAFFNASIQGTARMAETLAGPVGKKIIYGGVALGALQALIGMALMGGGDDDEWEKIPEFIKERSIIIPLSKEDFITIPLPLGFHVLPNIGRLATEFAFGGKDKTAGRQVGKLLGILAEAFNPIGSAGISLQTPMPTVFDPFVALAENRDWTGKPIYRENRNANDPVPGHARAKDSASTFSKEVTKAINAITGGNEYRPGGWSPTPDQLDYIIGQLTGGVGRELMKLEQTVTSPFTGDELPPHKIPMLGRLYGNTRGASGNVDKFNDNIRELNEIENEAKGRAKDRNGFREYLDSEPKIALVGPANAAENQVQKLRTYRRELVRRAAPGYKDEVKVIDERIGQVMKDLNRRVAEQERVGG